MTCRTEVQQRQQWSNCLETDVSGFVGNDGQRVQSAFPQLTADPLCDRDVHAPDVLMSLSVCAAPTIVDPKTFGKVSESTGNVKDDDFLSCDACKEWGFYLNGGRRDFFF